MKRLSFLGVWPSLRLEEATQLECILQADVSWSEPEDDGTGKGAIAEEGGGVAAARWTPDPFENCAALDLCALNRNRSSHRQLCDERGPKGGAGS